MANNEKPDDTTKEKWYNDDRNWKYGFVYFNPADKRIFPPKKGGGGWTINFANKISIIVGLALFLLLIATIIILVVTDKKN